MKELFKNALVNNVGRLVAGLLFTIVLGTITSVVIEPVKKVVEIPNQISELQGNFDNNMLSFQSSQKQFVESLEKQALTDSVIQTELEKINLSHKSLSREVAIVQTKLGTIKDELPALHQRFSDIENTVKHAQAINEFTASFNSNKFKSGRFNAWRKGITIPLKVNVQYDNYPIVVYQDTLNNIQLQDIAYQSFNSSL
ncbi:hypothetical protein [Saccharicrinis aurantiacus]|uniref:hypothetical protein n=1 Tax=Saccharicrinis aurantiacus TaxID=1849719 RepID=UPI00094FC074|nr:hypothetical protein [Saccharicrinis aurantiacus]